MQERSVIKIKNLNKAYANAMRYGFYGVSDVSPWLALGFLTVLTTALTICTLYLFRVGYKIRT